MTARANVAKEMNDMDRKPKAKLTDDANSLNIEWMPWVNCDDTPLMMRLTAGVLCEVRFNAADHVTAYRIAKVQP
jgi:hypothetical protein